MVVATYYGTSLALVDGDDLLIELYMARDVF